MSYGFYKYCVMMRYRLKETKCVNKMIKSNQGKKGNPLSQLIGEVFWLKNYHIRYRLSFVAPSMWLFVVFFVWLIEIVCLWLFVGILVLLFVGFLVWLIVGVGLWLFVGFPVLLFVGLLVWLIVGVALWLIVLCVALGLMWLTI